MKWITINPAARFPWLEENGSGLYLITNGDQFCLIDSNDRMGHTKFGPTFGEWEQKPTLYLRLPLPPELPKEKE